MFFKKKIEYLIPTPASVYSFAHNNLRNWQKTVLVNLFSLSKSPVLNNQTLASLFHTSNVAHIEFKLNECIEQGLIQVVTEEIVIPKASLEDTLKNLLKALSKEQKVLLSDSQGFCIVSHGFTDALSDEISALSVEIATLHRRRAAGISKMLEINSSAWSMVDILGKSRLGFWPLKIGEEVFVLAIEGKPALQKIEMVSLVWLLYSRYGKSKLKSRQHRRKNA